jgi:hypothetical protein
MYFFGVFTRWIFGEDISDGPTLFVELFHLVDSLSHAVLCQIIQCCHTFGNSHHLQRVPVIWFIANVGGILGLSMGCSLVTIFEIMHHALTLSVRTGVKSILSCGKRVKGAVWHERHETKMHYMIMISVIETPLIFKLGFACTVITRLRFSSTPSMSLLDERDIMHKFIKSTQFIWGTAF